MSEKRRSLLFPFHLGSSSSSSSGKDKGKGKFEVVNRKKSPLQMATSTPRTAPPSDSTTQTSSSKPSHSDPKNTVSSSTAATGNKKQHSTNKPTFGSSNDLIGKPLEITIDVPPVPDYNSISLAPPVTIQGRQVSMVAGKTQFRRKPPTPEPINDPEETVSEKEVVQQNPLETENSPEPALEKVDIAQVEGSTVSQAPVFQSRDSNVSNDSIQSTPSNEELNPFLSEEVDREPEHDQDSVLEQESLLPIPGSFVPPSDARTNSVTSESLFYDANEQTSKENVNKSQASFVMQPLNIHKKTPSSVTAEPKTNSTEESGPDEPGHQRNKLSLSDEILKDIQQFEPEFEHKEQDEDYIIDSALRTPLTPVSPLRNRDTNKTEHGTDTLLANEAQLGLANLTVEHDDLGDGTTELQKSTVQNSNVESDNLRSDDIHLPLQQESTDLFKDLSDSDLSDAKPIPIKDPINQVFGNVDHRLVSNSSVGAQVDYDDSHSQLGFSANSPVGKKSFLTDESANSDGRNSLNISEHSGDIVRSVSWGKPSRNLDDEQHVESNELSYGFSFPEQPHPHSVLHVVNSDVNDETDDDNYIDSDADAYQQHSNVTNNAKTINDDTTSPDLRSYGSDFKYDEQPHGVETEASQNHHTTFHVVNDGNYSSDDESNKSFDLKNREEDLFNREYPDQILIDQHNQKSLHSNDAESDDILSFTAKSTADTHFNFETNSPLGNFNRQQNISDYSVDTPQSFLSVGSPKGQQHSPVSPHQLQSPPAPQFQVSSLTSNYDRRNEPIAPVAYIDKNIPVNKSRRPPPGNESSIATRTARSASVSVSVPNVYNSIIREEDVDTSAANDGFTSSGDLKSNPGGVSVGAENRARSTSPNKTQRDSANHTPLVSSYVESIRFGTNLCNSSIPASKWGLPIGISRTDYSSKTSVGGPNAYRKLRSHKIDLKHGKIKARLLASEVDEDDTSNNNSTTNISAGSLGNPLDEPIGFILDSQSMKPSELGASLSPYSSSIATSLNTANSPRLNTDNSSIGPNINNISSPSVMTSTSSVNAAPHFGQNHDGGVQRTGTLMNHDGLPVVQIGRNGSVRQGNAGMMLYIANPDTSDTD